MRNAILVFHRWAALVTGALILVLALTGCLIALEAPIERLLHPELYRMSPAAGRPILPADSLVAAASRALAGRPGAGEPLSLLIFPHAPDRPAVLVDESGVEIFVSPYDGSVIGTRTAAEKRASFIRRVRELHVRLMAGEAGGEAAAAVTLLALVVVLLGVGLWWKEKAWRLRPSASWKRIAFDLHHLLGIAAAPVLALMLAGGLMIHYRSLSRLVGSLDRGPAPAPLAESSTPAGTPTIPLETALAVAARSLPGARIRSVSFSPDPGDPYRVALRYPEDHTPGGRSAVLVDRYTGAVLQVLSTRTAGTGTRINNLKRSIHTGDLFGLPTSVLWFFASLILAAQAMTGFLMWWNARGARRARAARS